MIQMNGELESVSIESVIKAGKFVGKAPYISNELYHGSPGLSASGLVKFSECPAIYKHNKDHPEDDESAPQRLGSLVHMKALEPELFDKTVVIVPGNGNATVVKEAIAEAEMQGKYVCRSQKEYDRVCGMVDSIMSRQWARTLLTEGEAEQSYFAHHPDMGFLMKCRPDRILEDKRIIVDLKTFGKLKDKLVDKQIRDQRYDWKAVYYTEVVSAVTGVPFNEWKYAHVFVSTDAPYEVRVLALRPPTIERAQEAMWPLYPAYSECVKTGVFPGFPDDIVDFDLWF